MYEKPINKVSHVVFCVKLENYDRIVKFWEDTYGVRFDVADVPHMGIRVKLAWEAGLEVIAPDPSIGPVVDRVSEFLEKKGEGVYTVVFGVRDIHEGIAQAEANGIKHTHRSTFMHHDRVERLEEAHLEMFMGTRVTLCQVEPKPGMFNT